MMRLQSLTTGLLLLVQLLATVTTGLDVHHRGQLYIQSTSPGLPPYHVPTLPVDPTEPRNIHLAFGQSELDLSVTWSTLVDIAPSMVRFRRLDAPAPNPWQMAKGISAKFVDGGPLGATQFVHRVTISGLPRAQRFEYSVGDGSGNWSRDSLDFLVPDAGPGRTLAVFGDLGLENAQSLPRLFDDAVVQRIYDAIVHVGDFAYDMPDDNGLVGDRFMQMLQPIAARVQYMTCVGNHEEKYNFSHYKARFSMPSWERHRMYYSVNIGPVHLVSISNEFYFFTNYGSAQIANQYRWLEADLRTASLNRSSAPWIVLIGHRPLYCSNNESRDCLWGAETLRDGIRGRWGLEPLMMRYGVDLAFWGHEHSYERTFPVANGRVVPPLRAGSDPYLNPRAPVHVITGSAGNREKHAYFTETAPPFSAFRSSDYGYTRLRFWNSTHVHLEQVSDDRGGEVIDAFTLVQSRHGPFQII